MTMAPMIMFLLLPIMTSSLVLAKSSRAPLGANLAACQWNFMLSLMRTAAEAVAPGGCQPLPGACYR